MKFLKKKKNDNLSFIFFKILHISIDLFFLIILT
jgi:uncharacterized protein with PQ loop repeat